ncbi:MAG: endonuclease/exonuclease/phosphatase family protein [Bradymonadales bacterium]|nr:endonuclease/exonuclease/phosphatase family protein [Bradymonadales bacterium]
MRLLSYNVRYFGHRSGGLASQDKTIRDVVRALNRLPGGLPDIICFQEIEARSLRADLSRGRRGWDGSQGTQLERFMELFQAEGGGDGETPSYQALYFPAHVYRFNRQRNLYTTGLAVLVSDRFQVLSHNADAPFDITHRRFSSLARWKQTRVCGHVRLWSREEGKLDLFNTHLSLPAFLTRDLWSYTQKMGFGINQMEEVKNLLTFIEENRDPQASTLLVGDFNSLPGSPVWKTITQQYRLTDVVRQRQQPKTEGEPILATAGVLGLALPIDYLFSDHQIDWLDTEGTVPIGTRDGLFHGLSDHVPLVARFRLARCLAAVG